MFFTPRNKTTFDAIETSKYTLVLPAVSVGNVGQLTVDILITTTAAEHIGMIYDESILPVIGNDPYTSSDTSKNCKLSSACDVYCSKIDRVLFIQQRAAFVKGKRALFRQRLIQWVKDKQFSKVFLLGSTFSHMRIDQQISGTQFRYLATEEAKSMFELSPNWKECEETPNEYEKMEKRLPGGGIAKTLYTDCVKEQMPLVVLTMFCSEGDNSLDAMRMAEYANEWLEIRSKTEARTSITDLQKVWKIPASWSLNFGSSFDKLLY